MISFFPFSSNQIAKRLSPFVIYRGKAAARQVSAGDGSLRPRPPYSCLSVVARLNHTLTIFHCSFNSSGEIPSQYSRFRISLNFDSIFCLIFLIKSWRKDVFVRMDAGRHQRTGPRPSKISAKKRSMMLAGRDTSPPPHFGQMLK
jgi:hypothetical protein